MSHKPRYSGEEELREYEYKYYEDLKSGHFKVKISGSSYSCPFCPGKSKEDYSVKELMNHASRAASGSHNRDLKEKAKHLALERYMKRHLDGKRESDEPIAQAKRPKLDIEGQFVWPWMGVVANIRTELKDEKRVAESDAKLRDEFVRKGFNPRKVHSLWNRFGHTGFAIVEFDHDWDGLKNAMCFERSFEADHCGKNDYCTLENRGDKLYGWIAREDDYNLNNVIGANLQKNGKLKTVSQRAAEDEMKTSKFVSSLTNTLKTRNKQLKELETKYYEASTSLDKLMMEKEAMIKSYNEEINNMQQGARDYLEKIYIEHEKVKLQLQAQKKELENREMELLLRQAHNESERKKVELEKKMDERALFEQIKADEKLVHLAEEQKKENEQLQKRIIELQRKLGAKQVLKLGHDEDVKARKTINTTELDLKSKEKDSEIMEKHNQVEHKSNDELQYAHKELINENTNDEDKILKNLKNEFGDVTKALMEVNAYNPNGTLAEGVRNLLKQWKLLNSTVDSQ